MKFVLVKAVAVLAACTSLVGVAEAKYLGNVTIDTDKTYLYKYPTAKQVYEGDLRIAKKTCLGRYSKSRSVSFVTYWKKDYYVTGGPVKWSVKSNWNCFDTSNGR